MVQSQGAGPKRFYAAVDVAPEPGGGFCVRLDGRTARTPAKAPLALPTEALAELIAGEWRAQEQTIELAAMPATRLAFTAIDRIGPARAAVAAEIARMGGADVVCYFADAPAALFERQTRRWGPVLDWAGAELGLAFTRITGMAHQAQPPETLARIEALALAEDDFGLGGLSMATGLFHSAVLALALQRDQLDGAAAFELSRLDEAFQEEQWGVDDEAAARAAGLRAEAVMLERWFLALGGSLPP
jgi:chaperone required for assembly of F1-ATPase